MSTWDESKHPRVPEGSPEGGQFTEKGEGAVSAAREAAGLATGLIGKLKSEGGFSKSLNGKNPDGGYMIALSKESEAVFDMEDLTDKNILNFILDHYDKLTHPQAFLGGWVDKGKVYLDISYNFQDLDRALNAAARADQLGIYDIEKGETIYLEEVMAR